MLSIAKLRVGQEAYQLSGVAQSLDDYYTGFGEADGWWAGVGAARLGLDGRVEADDLRAVLAGIAPGTGGLTPDGETIRPHRNRVPGFDLTFKVPKSVSVFYAVSDDPAVQAAIIESSERSVRAALGWLEREAIHVRRGTGNEAFLNDLAASDPAAAAAARIRSLPAQGLVAGVFRHRTSRAGDPLLHWHCLVANMAEGPDARWTAIVHPDLYRAVRAAGEVFQAVLRDELGEQLGVRWRTGPHVPEVAGIPQALLDQFSKRSQQIADWLAATGTPETPQSRQAAVLATRRSTPEMEHERFDVAWKAEAIEFGWGPADAERLIGAGRRAEPQRLDDHELAAATRRLTEHDSTFSYADAVQCVAATMNTGASMTAIEQQVAALIVSTHVVAIGDNRWTSRELLDLEQGLLTAAHEGIGTRSPIPSATTQSVVAGYPTLGADQAAAVTQLCAATGALTVMVGPAGTGKTFTLDAIRATFEASGYRVIGAAPSARAAQELQHGAHIPAVTLHRLNARWEHGRDLPNQHTLLVVDEAAMAGTRDLHPAVTTTIAAGGRVLFVGDHRQLPEVTAGGTFHALATGGQITTAELTENPGNVATAINHYRQHDRVDICDDEPAMIALATQRWHAATSDGQHAVLIAGTNPTVDKLNHTIHHQLATSGELGAVVGTWRGRELAVGERVVLRRNDYTTTATDGTPQPLLNGQLATITNGDADGITVRLDHHHTPVQIPATYLASGSVDYGYALTAHRAQGGTWDVAIAVGTDGLSREAGYLMLSRGRSHNSLIITRQELTIIDNDLANHTKGIPLPSETRDTEHDLMRALTNTHAKSLAHTLDPHAHLVDQLARHTDLTTLETLAANARQAEHTARTIIGTTPIDGAAAIERAHHTAHHITIGGAAKAADRNNVGTITAIDDQAGTAHLTFTSHAGHTAEREFRWDQLQVIDPETSRALSGDAAAALTHIVDEHTDVTQRWNEILASHNVAPDDTAIYGAAVNRHIDRAAASLTAQPTAWLTDTLGHRPTAPAAAQVWDDAVRAIATYRSRNHVAVDNPLGIDSITAAATSEQVALTQHLAEARLWLAADRPANPTLARTEPELRARLDQLDSIIATAPMAEPSTRHDAASVLAAVDPQDSRRDWILEHWPHIVEHAQVLDALAQLAPVAPRAVEDETIGIGL